MGQWTRLLPGAPADEAVRISVLVVGTSAMARRTMEGGFHLGQSMAMVGCNCHSRNTGLNHNLCRSNMVLDSDWCNGDCNLLAHLAGHLLSDRGANLASHLVALLHWGHHCRLHGHRDTLLDTPGVAHIVDHHISDVGAGGLWDGVAHSPGDCPWCQVAHWFGHSDALLSGGALGHCHALGHVDALGDGDAVGNGNAVGHGDTLGDAGALGDSDTVRDSNASGDGGAPGNVDADGSFNSARSLDRDAPALPPGDWLADRGDMVSNSNRRSNSNRCSNSNRSSNTNGSNRSRCNSMAEGNWADSGSNWSKRSCLGATGPRAPTA